jgi:CRISPR type I-E-associated protein CasB/Cse2
MKAPWIDPSATRFLDYLQRYKTDRGALAALRGGLSDARRPDSWPLLGGFSRDAIGNRAFEIVAALWAYEPGSVGDGNLGATLAGLRSEHNTFEARFKRLLACDKDEIAERVVPVVRAAQAKGKRVNYAQLLSDLLHWNDRARTDWAKSFWGVKEPDEIAPGLVDKEDV